MTGTKELANLTGNLARNFLAKHTHDTAAGLAECQLAYLEPDMSFAGLLTEQALRASPAEAVRVLTAAGIAAQARRDLTGEPQKLIDELEAEHADPDQRGHSGPTAAALRIIEQHGDRTPEFVQQVKEQLEGASNAGAHLMGAGLLRESPTMIQNGVDLASKASEEALRALTPESRSNCRTMPSDMPETAAAELQRYRNERTYAKDVLQANLRIQEDLRRAAPQAPEQLLHAMHWHCQQQLRTSRTPGRSTIRNIYDNGIPEDTTGAHRAIRQLQERIIALTKRFETGLPAAPDCYETALRQLQQRPPSREAGTVEHSLYLSALEALRLETALRRPDPSPTDRIQEMARPEEAALVLARICQALRDMEAQATREIQ